MMKDLGVLPPLLTAAAIASLVYRQGLFHPYVLQFYEILIFVALCAHFFARRPAQDGTSVRPLALGVAVFAACIVMGGIVSTAFFAHDASFVRAMAVDYMIFGSCLAGFFLVVSYARSKDFRGYALASFFSVAVLFPFVYVRTLRMLYPVVSGGFTGFHSSRTALGSLLVIPFAYFASLAVHAVSHMRRLAALAGLLPLTSLILWTGSRAAYGAALLGVLVIGAHGIYSKRAGNWLTFALRYALSVCCVGIIAYATLPAQAKNIVLLRFFPQYAYLQNIPSEEADFIAQRDRLRLIMRRTDGGFINYTVSSDFLLRKILSDGNPQFIDGNRLVFWAGALRLMGAYPFGLGPQFYALGKELAVGPHNTFFQVALYGGLPALAVFLTGLCVIGGMLWRHGDGSAEWVAIVAACVGFLFMFCFDDRLFDAWAWILAGLAASYGFQGAATKA